MNNDDHRNLPVAGSGAGFELDDCALQSHTNCDESDCEVQRLRSLLATISEGQVKVTITSMTVSLYLSGLYGLMLLTVWVWYSLVEKQPMPSVPWFVTTIALVPFGGNVVMKIAPKIRWQIGGPTE